MADDYSRAVEAFYEGDDGWEILQELKRINMALDVMLDRMETQMELLQAITREATR